MVMTLLMCHLCQIPLKSPKLSDPQCQKLDTLFSEFAKTVFSNKQSLTSTMYCLKYLLPLMLQYGVHHNMLYPKALETSDCLYYWTLI